MRARKYELVVYILASCYLKNTSRYKGKVNVIGAKADIVPDMQEKNKKPVKASQENIFVSLLLPIPKNIPPTNRARKMP